MTNVRLIQVNNGPILEFVLDSATTVGEFLSSKGIALDGRSVTVNGSPANEATRLEGNVEVILAKSSKGGS